MLPAQGEECRFVSPKSPVWANDGNRFQIMKFQIKKKPKSGFSLLELCVVMAIMLIVTALATPSIRRTMDGYRLNSSANAMKEMLEQAKTAASKADEPYYAQVSNVDPMKASAQSASGAGSRPAARTSGTIVVQPVGPGNINALINALGGIAPAPAGTPIGFNARGVPCTQANPANPYLCPGPTAFIWFMQSNTTGDWAAVTVTPAGRIRTWRFISTAGTWE